MLGSDFDRISTAVLGHACAYPDLPQVEDSSKGPALDVPYCSAAHWTLPQGEGAEHLATAIRQSRGKTILLSSWLQTMPASSTR